ncbi:MAG TPA: hypothetical protein VGM52_11785 [Herbaspirillum sp.]|jgi:hypothetical protein
MQLKNLGKLAAGILATGLLTFSGQASAYDDAWCDSMRDMAFLAGSMGNWSQAYTITGQMDDAGCPVKPFIKK